jgi:predicted CoA-substrate-specific enzyme activase
MANRFIGIDVGAETLKVVELERRDRDLRWVRRALVDHRKEPGPALLKILHQWGWEGVGSAAATGRLCRSVNLPRIPLKEALASGFRFLHGSRPATVVSIGSHGFSVLELRANEVAVFRENNRCSQGTGNFLRQLVERFDLTIEEASRLCANVQDPAPLSGRCPVILKTDMTHLANKGESRARILAGLYDAVCENVQVLIKPLVSPSLVLLVGGVSRSERIREHFRRFLGKHDMMLLEARDEEERLFLEALGCAVVASGRDGAPLPSLDRLIVPVEANHLERLPPLSSFLDRVVRMECSPVPPVEGGSRCLILGFDIGSTGSKLVALDSESARPVWEGYCRTNGNPVGAAQTLMRQFVESDASQWPVHAVGVTGSGREIVGSLLSICYGVDSVYILNEIAAHAEGALSYDPRVDTIFEIGGQDAKYIRLSEGRVVDAAMNEACSAGTGSFIEEQGRKFAGVRDVVELGQQALAAPGGVSLGQHCSVFMAEIIDQAVAAGVEQRSIIAGIYDSIIQNYLNRVKGPRSVGQVIFCQGMPFSSDALAAAVARQTGSQVIVPPHPGTVGALGIALLARRALPTRDLVPLDLQRFLDAAVEKKDTFICKSTQGCGGAGNKCRIDRITTRVGAERKLFLWGGGCSLYDKGTRKRKLPDLAPDPFRERGELVQEIIARTAVRRGLPRIALTDEFLLKGLFPFFATFLHELGFDLEVFTGADQSALKRGIEEANVPFCAPMQQYHGLVSAMVETRPDFLFLPMIRSAQKVRDEKNAVLCPIVQASPDLLRQDFGARLRSTIVSPVVNVGPGNLESEAFQESCRHLAESLGLPEDCWRRAHRVGVAVQTRFEWDCLALGRRALQFCEEKGYTPVIVLGRPYTIYNTVLNSNVPAILREQGTVAVPVDCYPVDENVPIFEDMFWSFGQRNLRAAHQIRRTPGHYSVYCSNYSCGPDSFNLHFYSYLMEGKPFAVIETDGHSGDAGTKTRIEAFLHCVDQDLAASASCRAGNDLSRLESAKAAFPDIRARRETILIPRMGPTDAAVACLQGLGLSAEALPMPDRETVRLGRRHTSGKECVPMCLTLGLLLQRLARARETNERFAFFMPNAPGPCRFGVYNLLHKITLERLDLRDRVRVWTPTAANYFEGQPPGFATLVFTGMMAADLLEAGLHDVRPVESHPGAAKQIHDRYRAALGDLLRRAAGGDLSLPAALLEVASGRLFGTTDLLRRAASELRVIKRERDLPTVAMVGEIYVRCEPFANDFLIERLEAHGIRVRFAPFDEWLEYTDYVGLKEGRRSGFGAQMSSFVQARIQNLTYAAMAETLGWPARTRVRDSLGAAAPYLREELLGEAVLTLGGPIHEWREGHIDAVVSVGPLECMPTKIAEAQFFHIAEKEGLLSLTVALNGDPLDPEVVDAFAFEVHERFRRRQEEKRSVARTARRPAGGLRRPGAGPSLRVLS